MSRGRRGKRDRSRGLDADGVPIDGREWTERDWSDLWHGMMSIKARIAKRHGPAPRPATEPGTLLGSVNQGTKKEGADHIEHDA